MLCRFPTLCYTSLQVLMTFYASKWTLSPSCCILKTLFFFSWKKVFSLLHSMISQFHYPELIQAFQCIPYVNYSFLSLFLLMSFLQYSEMILWILSLSILLVPLWWMLYIHNPQKNEPVLPEPVISMRYSPNLRKSIISSEVNWAPSFCFATVLFCQSN